MKAEEAAKKKFDRVREEIRAKYEEVSEEVDLKIRKLLEKTYKQFEKTYGADSRRA